MHREQSETIGLKDIAQALNKHSLGELSRAKLVKLVCSYFDQVKTKNLTERDKAFLFYAATEAGVPQYYDILRETFNTDTQIKDWGMLELSNYYHNLTLYTSPNNKLHKMQKEIFDLFKINQINRFFLSASTSFGKTYLVYEILKKMKYKNILLIFPTIALLSENLEKILNDADHDFFNQYNIVTLSDANNFQDKNIFVYTPERYLSFVDKHPHEIHFDFIFIDEIYKIDNDFIIDETVRENERDIAYRVSSAVMLKDAKDILLAGPYINLYNEKGELSGSFNNFLNDNNIKYLDYNDYEIVGRKNVDIKQNTKKFSCEDFVFDFSELGKNNKTDKYISIIKTLLNNGEKCIVYCADKKGTRSYAKYLLDILPELHDYDSQYALFLEHIKSTFSEDWLLYKALKKGVGIHNGLVPKYIQKEIIKFFNQGELQVLTTTTTITEGVNTSAKNILVTLCKKSPKPLKPFDAKNIAGRAGRFLHHYSGRVIVLQNNFMDVLYANDAILEHKNYDKTSAKTDIDLDYTRDNYLSEQDLERKKEINRLSSLLPGIILTQFKTISKQNKVSLFHKIMGLTSEELAKIENCVNSTMYDSINFDGFQIFLNTIKDIAKDSPVYSLINNKASTYEGKEFSVLVYMVSCYLKAGFHGEVKYYIEKKNLDYDRAIRTTADFIYNKLKYHLVKYLGIFNLIYKYRVSQTLKCEIDDVTEFDRLLSKFEYNAYTEKGKMASDYGAPDNVIKYVENIDNENIRNKIKLDNYEKTKLTDILKIISIK